MLRVGLLHRVYIYSMATISSRDCLRERVAESGEGVYVLIYGIDETSVLEGYSRRAME